MPQGVLGSWELEAGREAEGARRGPGCGAGGGLRAQYLEVDEDRGGQYPKALQEVPQHMHKGCPDAGVPEGQGLPWPLLQRCILRSPRPVAVRGAGLVQHKRHSEGEAEQLSPGGLFPASSALFPHLSTSPPQEPFLHLFSPYFPSPRRKTTLPRDTNRAAWGGKYRTWCWRHGFRS